MQVERFLHPALHIGLIVIATLFSLACLGLLTWVIRCVYRAVSCQGISDGEVILLCFAALLFLMTAGLVYEIVHPTEESPASQLTWPR
jgi:hypothetical protein